MNAEQDLRCGNLMELAQRGDQKSYEQLLTELLPTIRQFCSRRVGFLGMTDDVVQEALIAIHKARHTYDKSRKFSPWMYAIVRYKMIDAIRSNKIISENELLNVDNTHAQPQAPNDVRDERSILLKEELKDLDPAYKEVLELTKIHGLSISETAKKLKIAESAVKVRIHRGVKILKKSLERKLRG